MMMSILTYAGGFFQVLSMLFYLHPIHVTVTEIEFDEKDKALEIVMRVFIDDLELTLREKLKEPELDIMNPKNGQTTDQIIAAYLPQHFGIALDNKQQKVNYLGHEQDEDAFVFYIEVTNVKKWKTIQVRNEILTDFHDDQSNLVHVTVQKKVRSMRLTRETPADKLLFQDFIK